MRRKTTFFIGKYIGVIMLSYSFCIGLILGIDLNDNDLDDSKDQLLSLMVKKDSLSYQAYQDSLNKYNIKELDSSLLMFNTVDQGLPTITVKNIATSKCLEGYIDGCWKTSANVSEGQIVAVQLMYHNWNPIDVDSVSLNIRFISSPLHTSIFCLGSLLVKNNIIRQAIAIIYLHNIKSFSLSEKYGDWIRSVDIKKHIKIPGIDALYPKPFYIGKVHSYSSGVIVNRYLFE